MEHTGLNLEKHFIKLNKLKDKTLTLFDDTNNYDLKRKVSEELKEIESRENIKIAFVGQYSAGKSTIISALTGNREIEIDSNVATDEVTYYKWNNLVLMDTPGIMAGKNETHDKKTKEALNECDLIVYVLTSQLFDDVIFENFIDLAYKQSFKDKMLTVVNKMSMDAGEFSELEETYQKSLTKIFDEKRFTYDFDTVFIDAADYIDGVESDDKELIEVSNFNSFITTLNNFAGVKGLIKKKFDTPIRVLRSSLLEIIRSDIDPQLFNKLDSDTSAIERHKRDVGRKIKILLLRFEQEVRNKGYLVTSNYGEISQVEFDNNLNNFNSELNIEVEKLFATFETLIEEHYDYLINNLKEIEKKETTVLFEKQLDIRINNPNITIEEKKNLQAQRNILSLFNDSGSKIAAFAKNNVEGATGLSQVSGSPMHILVKNIGGSLNHNFKPWGAIKTAKNIGNIGSKAVPVAITAISMYMDHKESKNEEHRLKEISNAKLQINGEIQSTINNITSFFNEEANKTVINTFNLLLDEVNKRKIIAAEAANKNEELINYIKNLDSEYVDFIEIIE